jgi:hypothetical protein
MHGGGVRRADHTRRRRAVTIEIRPGEKSYEATERNGISSLSYGSWGGSFVFIDD